MSQGKSRDIYLLCSFALSEMRKEAGGCLVNFLKDEKALKRPECRALLQQQSSQLQLCPDRETRKILVHFLSKNQQSEEALPPNLHMEHLSSMYSTQTLEINETIVHKSSSCFISHGMFQRKKVPTVLPTYLTNTLWLTILFTLIQGRQSKQSEK